MIFKSGTLRRGITNELFSYWRWKFWGALDVLLVSFFGLLGKGRYRGAPGGLGEVQSNLAGQIGGE